MKVDIFSDEAEVARQGAALIAADARQAVATRGQFHLAISGGHTPWLMLRELAKEMVPWQDVQIFQVDERVAPAGDPDRNLTHLRASLLDRAPIAPSQIHAMPVETGDLARAAQDYANLLKRFCSSPPVLDLIHLGLGPDGHTASLVPNDPVLEVQDADVAATGIYQGRRRLTLTYPVLNVARRLLWLVTGAGKAEMLMRLRSGDPRIPAGRVNQDQALVLCDQVAAPGESTV